MSLFARRILSLILLLGLCIHIGFIFIYGSPLKMWSQKVNFVSTYYYSPFISQNWSLFVPAPKSTHKLYVRYKVQDRWSNWQDILEEEINNHKRNRISGNENIVLLLSNSMHYVMNDLPQRSSIYLDRFESKAFEVLEYEVNQYLKCRNALAAGVDFEILITKNNSNLSAYYFKSLTIKH